MDHRPINLIEMGTGEYDITRYQRVLYVAESLEEVRVVIGGFLRDCNDESIPNCAPAQVMSDALSSARRDVTGHAFIGRTRRILRIGPRQS